MRRSTGLPLLALAAVALAGCVSVSRPTDCDDDGKTIRLTVEASAMEPNDPAACRGQDVRLVVDSEVDGVLHIHGLDDVVSARSITAGEETRLQFAADRSGQFPMELHTAGDTQGVTVGILTIHER